MSSEDRWQTTTAPSGAPTKQTSYDAQDITVLEGLEAVRRRPGMYIGSTGPARAAPPRLRGRRQLCRRGARRLLRRASRSRSIPTTRSRSSTTAAGSRSPIMEKEKRPAVEVVLTVLHAGGKFGEGGGYKVSGGLHGVGVSVVNALSERLDVEVRRDGFVWTPVVRARQAARRPAEGRADQGDRHDDHVPARRRHLRVARVRLHDARGADAGDRIPDPRPADHARRRARRGSPGRVPLRGRDRRLRRLPQPRTRSRSTRR